MFSLSSSPGIDWPVYERRWSADSAESHPRYPWQPPQILVGVVSGCGLTDRVCEPGWEGGESCTASDASVSTGHPPLSVQLM